MERDISLDDRRRASLGKIGHSVHDRYRVTEMKNGTLIFTPLGSIPIEYITNPKILAALEKSREDMDAGRYTVFRREDYE